MAKTTKTLLDKEKSAVLPSDYRESIHWFVDQIGIGANRNLFLCDFSNEHEAVLTASLLDLQERGVEHLVLTGQSIYKQAEYLWDLSRQSTSFGRPAATKVELDINGTQVLFLTDLEAPEGASQLWYLYHYVLYPRALSNKPTFIATPLSYEEFVIYGAGCEDIEYAGRKVTWEKILWLLSNQAIDLAQYRHCKEEKLPPLLACEALLYKTLKDRKVEVTLGHRIGDWELNLALVQREQKLAIQCDLFNCLDLSFAYGNQAELTAKLLTEGWQILRFTAAEILNNVGHCADAVAEVWQQGRKKAPVGWHLNQEKQLSTMPTDDEEQRVAVAHTAGPAAIAGSAGSGKTTCALERVAFLLAQGINPERILVLGQSPEIARIYKSGLEKLVDRQTAQRVNIYAWHELGIKVLKENLSLIKRKPPLKIETNTQKIVQRLLAKQRKEIDPTSLELSEDLDEFTLAALISLYKANLVSPKYLKEQSKGNLDELVAKVYLAYEEQLQKSNRVDRDDMITLAAQLLADNPEVRAKYQYLYDFVIIDDYQDATPACDLMARLLAFPQDNLYVLGDEDEAVYETKGASPRLLGEVSIRLPNTRCYKLEQNWRSHPSIVEHANTLLGRLTRRQIKLKPRSPWQKDPAEAVIGPNVLENEHEEADWIAEEIQLLLDTGRSAGDIAVLYRYHRFALIVKEALVRKGIRCHAAHQETGFLPDEVGDVMSFLKLVMDPDGPKARESFERICQLRVREVDPKLSSTIASFAEANNLSYLKGVEIYSEAVAEPSCRELEQLVRIIRTMHQEKFPPAEAIGFLIRTQRLKEYYESIKVPPGVNYEPLRALNQLQEVARSFKTVEDFVNNHVSNRQGDDGTDGARDTVSILTIHEAKGHEFQIVFLGGLAEGLFPSETASDLEEERRLCYVAMTRAREMLYLSFPKTFSNIPLQPSVFLSDAGLVPANAHIVHEINSEIKPATKQHTEPESMPKTVAESAAPIEFEPILITEPMAEPEQKTVPPVEVTQISPNVSSEQPKRERAKLSPQLLLNTRTTAETSLKSPTSSDKYTDALADSLLKATRPALDITGYSERNLPNKPANTPNIAYTINEAGIYTPIYTPEAETLNQVSTNSVLANQVTAHPLPARSSPNDDDPIYSPKSINSSRVNEGSPFLANSNAIYAPKVEPQLISNPLPAQLSTPAELPGSTVPQVSSMSNSSAVSSPSVTTCARCAAELLPGTRFCAECGMSVSIASPARNSIPAAPPIPACRSCGAPQEEAAKFCGECGMPQISVGSLQSGYKAPANNMANNANAQLRQLEQTPRP